VNFQKGGEVEKVLLPECAQLGQGAELEGCK
jgi:hypothetical protein